MKQHVLLTIFTILLSACSAQHDDYFPLDAGKTWVYQMHYETMDGKWTIPYVISNLSSGKDKHGDKTYLRRSLDGRVFHYQWDDAGLKMLQRSRIDVKSVNPQIYANSEYLYQYPINVGTRWRGQTQSQTLIKTGPPWKTEFRIVTPVPVENVIESMDEAVTVIAGSFQHCMKIHQKGTIHFDAGNYVGLTEVKVDEYRWYCPGVGLVKSVRHETTTNEALDKGMMSLELERFHS